MDQNNMNNNTGMPATSSPAPAGGMSFVTGSAPENVAPQSVVQQPVVAPQPVASAPEVSVTAAPAPTTPPVVNDVLPAQPVASEVTPMAAPTVTSESLVGPQPVSQPVQNAETPGVMSSADVMPNQGEQVVQPAQPVQSVNGLNTIPPAQPSIDAETSSDGNTVGEEKKGKNPIVILLVIILLAGIGVALGIFLFDKFGNKGNNEEEPDVQDQTPATLSSNVINNTNVDVDKLNEVLELVGIASTNAVANNDSLNYYVSNNNYVDNANNVVVYYAVDADGNTTSEITYPDEYDKASDVGACSDAINCALISKTDAENLLKKFNLGTELDKYFYKSSEIDDVYGIHYEDYTLEVFNNDNAGITHNLTAEMVDDTDIKVSDTQSVSTVDADGNVQSVDKNVVYVFKLSDDGSYHLDSVTVSE